MQEHQALSWILYLFSGSMLLIATYKAIVWGVEYHHEATREENPVCIRGTFYDFLEEVSKKDWTYDPVFPNSLFAKDSEIHASIIAFDGKGMLLNYWDYKKAKKFVKDYIKNERYSCVKTPKEDKKKIHHEMTKNSTKVYKEGTYLDFLVHFNSREWKVEPEYPNSVFSKTDDSKVHASIIQFDEVGMLLDAEDFYWVQKMLKKEIKAAKENGGYLRGIEIKEW